VTIRSVASLIIFGASTLLSGQDLPKVLQGKWVVRRVIPTSTISCWGQEEAEKLIGSTIEYTPDVLRWGKTEVKQPAVEVRTVTAEHYAEEYSGGVNDSQVSFRQLGIRAPRALEITIKHPPAEITGTTIEIPGDDVLIKAQNTIVFSVCNVYFEATRVSQKSGSGVPKQQ
jgi:hypothetical protein